MKKYTGKIEDMPLSARLTGFVVKEKILAWSIGDFSTPSPGFSGYHPEVIESPYTAKPDRIEVHEDIITLMCGAVYHKGHKHPMMEINIPVGTLVQWEV